MQDTELFGRIEEAVQPLGRYPAHYDEAKHQHHQNDSKNNKNRPKYFLILLPMMVMRFLHLRLG